MNPISDAVKAGMRSLTRRVLRNDSVWRVLGPVSRKSGYLRVQRDVTVEQRLRDKCARFFRDDVVGGGLFAGMKYPAACEYWSSPYPKLLGSYEAELDASLRQLIARDCTDVVDIGFAEGYYLVGLAQLLPHVQVWGFDIDPRAHAACAGLAAINGIAPARLHFATHATPEALVPALASRALVVCDCEGFEATLFAEQNRALWHRADLVIECHDFIVPNVTSTLARRLQETHHVTTVRTQPAENKLALLSGAARNAFSNAELVRLLNEGRPAPMTWIIGASRARERSPIAAG